MTDGRRRYRLRELTRCSTAQQEAIRLIRNEPAIREAMYTDHEIGRDEHRSFLQGLAGDPSREYYALLDDYDVAIGSLNFGAIDPVHSRLSFGFFLTSSARGGLGSTLELRVLDHVFDERRFERLTCEVLDSNPRIVRMHRNFGFMEEGYLRSHHARGDYRLGVHLLGMLRHEWPELRPAAAAFVEERAGPISIAFDE